MKSSHSTRAGTIRLAVLLAVVMTAATARADDALGHARLHPIGQTGIQGRIFFVDAGSATSGLFTLGMATGLNPAERYISLLYDNGSIPGGPNACEPSTPDPLTGAQMFIGTWQVDPDGTGTLNVRKTGASYVPLRLVRTVSIRKVVAGSPAVLQACGEIGRNP